MTPSPTAATAAGAGAGAGAGVFVGRFGRILSLGPDVPSASILQHAHEAAVSAGADGLRGAPEESINVLAKIVKTQSGRDAFVTVLNQFRSRKVDVGLGFTALGAVLWEALSCCAAANDVHTAKIVMMLSQTFYRTIEGDRPKSQAALFEDERPARERPLFSPDDEDDNGRDTAMRQYLKDRLVDHHIWHDGTFWEQVLWQCTIEQVRGGGERGVLCFFALFCTERAIGLTHSITQTRTPAPAASNHPLRQSVARHGQGAPSRGCATRPRRCVQPGHGHHAQHARAGLLQGSDPRVPLSHVRHTSARREPKAHFARAPHQQAVS